MKRTNRILSMLLAVIMVVCILFPMLSTEIAKV